MSETQESRLAQFGSKESGVNLRAVIKDITAGKEITENREDINALSGIFIEEMWQPIGQWMQENKQGMPMWKRSKDKGVTYDVAKKGELSNLKYSEDIIEEIRSEMKAFVTDKIEKWYSSREERRLNPPINRTPEEIKKDEWYERYVELTSEHKQASRSENPEEHIHGGLNTAIDTTLNFFKVLPHVYRNEFHPNRISSEQAQMIAEKSRKTILVLATMHITYFNELEFTLMRSSAERTDFDPLKFTITSEDNSLRMKVRDEILQQLHEVIPSSAATTGCPALAVKGPGGKNVVTEFYEWLLQIAKDQYFPFFDKTKQK